MFSDPSAARVTVLPRSHQPATPPSASVGQLVPQVPGRRAEDTTAARLEARVAPGALAAVWPASPRPRPGGPNPRAAGSPPTPPTPFRRQPTTGPLSNPRARVAQTDPRPPRRHGAGLEDGDLVEDPQQRRVPGGTGAIWEEKNFKRPLPSYTPLNPCRRKIEMSGSAQSRDVRLVGSVRALNLPQAQLAAACRIRFFSLKETFGLASLCSSLCFC
jgi:hypothetical protein